MRSKVTNVDKRKTYQQTQPGFPDQADHNLAILWHHTKFLTMILP